MKKSFLALSCVAAIWLCSCSGRSNKTPDGKDAAANTPEAVAAKPDTTAAAPQSQRVQIRQIQNDSIILATAQAGDLPDSINLTVVHPYQQIHILIEHVHTDSLIATLRAVGEDRNIRINQIVMPDHKMDGPFGHEIRYGTRQQGDYTLILGKDNMADGTVEGQVRVEIQLK